MIEQTKNLWAFDDTYYKVITTNGFVKRNGKAVMGRGCAREACCCFPKLPAWLGIVLLNKGNHVHMFPNNIITFPVKHNWWEEADTGLIERSVGELIYLVDGIHAEKVVMPRPGCGNGKLDWEEHVKPLLEHKLDDRFTIVTF